MQQPYSNIHIDGLMNAISDDMVLIHAGQVPYDIVDMLKKKGYKILEAPSRTEVRDTFGINFVTLEPGHIVMPAGNPRTQELLEKNGVKVEAPGHFGDYERQRCSSLHYSVSETRIKFYKTYKIPVCVIDISGLLFICIIYKPYRVAF